MAQNKKVQERALIRSIGNRGSTFLGVISLAIYLDYKFFNNGVIIIMAFVLLSLINAYYLYKLIKVSDHD